MEYVDLKGFEDKYKISVDYPYEIINKETNKVLSENSKNKAGYNVVYLNKKQYLKHKLIAEQFIDNPNNYQYVEHINDIKNDNRIDNLIWISCRDKCMNKTSYQGKKINFVKYDDMNEDDMIYVNNYGRHDFENYYYNKQTNKFYYDTCKKYKELNISINEDGSECVNMKERRGRRISIVINKFKKIYNIN